ncbi:ragulator complex protein LAMTOR1-like isoform X2 [Physella acuta]|uniref:ragulator complex protein LAMTOR1-like isoform X2 n=1 Tax=Physella acuta TaxID=109671 RepID=UPI0027DB70EC|nr:ragulator complex protein LAMTOR1-like isoform X2 [Physella acuta]
MGCCFSSDEDKDITASERAPLLIDPSDRVHTQPVPGRPDPSYPQTPTNNETSEFSRILKQTAINVIDVTSNESQNMEQGEMQDRAIQYSNRLNMMLSGSGKTRIYRPNLPNGMTSPQMTLSAAPVSLSDVQLITSCSEKLALAAKDIKIQHKENLVVTFGVP